MSHITHNIVMWQYDFLRKFTNNVFFVVVFVLAEIEVSVGKHSKKKNLFVLNSVKRTQTEKIHKNSVCMPIEQTKRDISFISFVIYYIVGPDVRP